MLDSRAYPPRQRWVRDVTAYSRANCGSVGLLVGTLWCRLQHQRPTSDEVGMRKTLNAASNKRGSGVGSSITDPPLRGGYARKSDARPVSFTGLTERG